MDVVDDKAVKKEDKGEIDELKRLLEDYKESLQRLQADFENSRKRLEREKQEFLELAGAKVIEDFLPLIDSLSSAVENAKKSGNVEMKEGVEKILAQAKVILARQGVEEIQTKGQFDMRFHECMMVENDNSKGEGEIIEELQKGYLMHGRVIRPAKVKVNKIVDKAE